MAKNEYSRVTFIVVEPEGLSEEDRQDAFDETQQEQDRLDQEHLLRLEKLFKPYGFTVVKEETD